MRRYSLLFMSVLLLTASCAKKDNDVAGSRTVKEIPDDNGCVTRVWHSTDYLPVAKADSLYAVTLFHGNNMVNDGLRITYVSYDTVDGNAWVTVLGDQYVNGLRVFPNNRWFNFKNGQLAESGPWVTIQSNLDTIPKLRIAQVRTLFMRGGNIAAVDHHRCVNAQFGYFDKNARAAITNPNSTHTPNLVKAWRIQFNDVQHMYPIVYYSDDGDVLLLDDGMLKTSGTVH